MDFQAAEIRLTNDHNKLRSRTRNRNASRTLASSAAASKAKKAEEYRRKQLEKKKWKDQLESKKINHLKNGFDQIERRLGLVRELNDGAGTDSVRLEAVSVHGLGDKITLPTSILSTLAERDLLQINQERGQPLFFRIGIRKEGYSFPQSDAMKMIMDDYGKEMDASFSTSITSEEIGVNGEDDDDEFMNDENDDKRDMWMKAYLEELSCQYVSYTYATVVEFSQDEGFIGLPSGTSNALIQKDGPTAVESKLTVDPANVSQNEDAAEMDIASGGSELLEDKTPGHAAYGLFPVPIPLIDVTLLTHLPMGEKCTLQPTENAIENGFYHLKNVKLALEQSLIRTRGSLNEGDVMHCWFRGKKFDLSVQQVQPPDIGAISCVNCDIEVDIAPPASHTTSTDSTEKEGGYKLSDTPSEEKHIPQECVTKRDIDLTPEPSDDEKDIIVVQIRGKGKVSRRKFLLISSLKQLFDFTISEGLAGEAPFFKLVTRFPRRVFQIGSADEDIPLSALGLSKQEAFMVEE
jgi:hypothetical protein